MFELLSDCFATCFPSLDSSIVGGLAVMELIFQEVESMHSHACELKLSCWLFSKHNYLHHASELRASANNYLIYYV